MNHFFLINLLEVQLCEALLEKGKKKKKNGCFCIDFWAL